MAAVVSIMDRDGWRANTDNMVVVDPVARRLLWIPRDLWCERIGHRINRAFARASHEGLIAALADQGIAVDHSLCLRRSAVERALAGVRVRVQVARRIELWYPLDPLRRIEDGRKRVVFDPPGEVLSGERLHQWLGARCDVEPAPLLVGYDFGRMRRQQVFLRRLLEAGFDFRTALSDPTLVSASSPAALEAAALVRAWWRFEVVEDVRQAERDGRIVLERTAAPATT